MLQCLNIVRLKILLPRIFAGNITFQDKSGAFAQAAAN